ncbi:histidine phosphatase family protein [Ottowia sp.]|uniref:histidine phosphatase family protein n=1 Tax=Ottowia sp. TaxID=1898956 RepID=UPI0039E52704
MPVTAWLLRHGQSVANVGLPTDSHEDVALTALGEAQAQEAALRVVQQPDLIVISPFLRAQATARPLRARWPAAPVQTWPIQEFTYLAPARCRGTTADMRRPWVLDYWERADPGHCDGEGAESFAGFMRRLADFRARLLGLGDAFVVAVGHGQFFKGCLWGEALGYPATAAGMAAYREAETRQPMRNGEILIWQPVPPSTGELDLERALNFLDGDTEILRELLATFGRDALPELAGFRAAIAESNRAGILKYLHRQVPTLAIIAAESLHAQAQALYQELRAQQPAAGEGVSDLALQRCAGVADAMDRLLAQAAAQVSR